MNAYDEAQLGAIEPPYLKKYGLSEAPFAVAADARFFYADGGRVQQTQLLQHLIDFSEVMVLVTGERGSGKTSFIRYFADQCPERWRVCCIDVHAMMDADQLLLAVAQGFGAKVGGAVFGELNEALYEQLLSLHRSHTSPVLLLDNAHDLPEDALEALFHLADVQSAESQRLLRTVMFCEPQIEQRFESSVMKPLRERVTHTMEIPRLREEDVAQYLRHRLTVAGWHGAELPFSPKEIHRISKVAQGLPGRVNHEAHLVLSKVTQPSEPSAAPRLTRLISMPRSRLAIIVALVAVVVAVFVLQRTINSWFDSAPTSSAAPGLPVTNEADRVTLPLAVPEPPSAGAPESKVAGERPEDEGAAMALADSPPPLLEETELEPAAEVESSTSDEQRTAPKPLADASSDVVPLSLHTIEPNLIEGTDSPQTLTLSGGGFSERTVVTVKWADQETVLPPAQVTLDSAGRMRIRVTTGHMPGQWRVRLSDSQAPDIAEGTFAVVAPESAPAAAAPEPVATAKAAAPAPIATPLRLHGRDWILGQDPEHFTAQLFASYEQDNVETFARGAGLGGDAAIYETSHNDRPWFVLVHGVYASKDDAKQGVSKLPDAVRRAKPWIRRLDSVHASLTAPVASNPKPVAAVPAAAPQRLEVSSHEAWLWAQDPRHFTLQLMGSRSEANIQSFIRQHDLKGQVAYFHTRHNGRDWYAAVFGTYPDRGAAEAAAKALPESLRKLSPWVRSFSSIHADLDRAEP